MTSLTVYDPPMCCATGVCGADVDQRLVDFAADLDWLKSRGAEIRRINLSQEPMEFISNPAIKELMDAGGDAELPAIMADGEVVSKARFPGRAELAVWAGVAAQADAIDPQTQALICIGAAVGAGSEANLAERIEKARALGASEDAMRAALTLGQSVRDASAGALRALGEKLIPSTGRGGCCGGGAARAETDTGCCGGSSADEADAGCCGGSASGEEKTASGCC